MESSYHGSALLYRLLQGYPTDKLLIFEAAPWRSRKERRLSNADYRSFAIGNGRLLNSRLSKPYGSWVLRRAPDRWRQLAEGLNGFEPTAILTVVHGYSWLSAAEFARATNFPLHLILHDDWLSSLQALPQSKGWAEQVFALHYRRAATRFCVSPAMAQRYQEAYGVAGEVLYPVRAANSPVASEPAPIRDGDSLAVGYAGTINGAGYVARLRMLAAVLKRMGGTLLIYGPTTSEQAKSMGLDVGNVLFRGLIPSEQLIVQLRQETDLLFAPMSFRSEDRTNMELSFPSKLTDYTAVGLPVLVNGPAYCSAVRWAKENSHAAEVVEVESDAALADALVRLKERPELTRDLAAGALAAGERCFSFAALSTQFYAALRRGSP